MAYRIVYGVSTRKSNKKEDPDYEKFLSYRPGDIVEEFPSWVPVDELKKSGHIEIIKQEAKSGSVDAQTRTVQQPEDRR